MSCDIAYTNIHAAIILEVRLDMLHTPLVNVYSLRK